ncbi:MAG: tetratricopeptide repeat protein [Desulfuromonadales bacterium]|nr:tetratricopeptide repeat protein [Desulfuromonadales bacterium]
MSAPQIILFAFCLLLFLAAIFFFYRGNNGGGTVVIIAALTLCLVSAVGPTTISNLVLEQTADGFKLDLCRNVDTPEKIEAHLQAAAEINKGDKSAATHEIVQEIAETPDAKRSAADYLVLATTSWKQAHYIDGLAYAQQGLRLQPEDERLHATLLHRMGALLVEMGDNAKAEEYFHKAIAADPTFSWPYNNLGLLLIDLKRYDEASAALQKALELDPDDPEIHDSQGDLFRSLKRYDEAEAAYRKAIELDPDEPLYQTKLRRVLEGR